LHVRKVLSPVSKEFPWIFHSYTWAAKLHIYREEKKFAENKGI